MNKIKQKSFPKLILVSLSLILVLESIFLVIMVKRIDKLPKNLPEMAILSLEPREGSFQISKEFEVKIILDTGGFETDATDVRLKFDPQILAVNKIQEGKVYDNYPAKRIDQQDGTIIINGITSLNKTFKGKGIFASIYFKGLKPGKASLIFEYAPDSTIDSNVVASKIAKDVLGEVGGASLEIN